MLMSGILNFNSVCYDADDSIDVWIEKFVSKDKYSWCTGSYNFIENLLECKIINITLYRFGLEMVAWF